MDNKFSIVKLNNTNYQSWQFKIKLFLQRDDLWQYIEPGTPPNPVTTAWTAGDTKAFATIGLLVEDNQHNIIMGQTTAKGAWNALKSYHHKATLTSKVTLLKLICNKNFRDGESMEQHLFDMEDLFAKLENAGQKLEEKLKVAMILRSLPDSFDTLCTALESRDDNDLTMDLVRGKLIDLCSKCEAKRTDVAMKVKVKGKPIECFHCHKVGHMKRDCKELMKKNGGKSESGKPGKANSAKESSDSKAFSFMVRGQHGLQSSWLVDSGASSHMCRDKDFFISINETSLKSVIVANGIEMKVHGEGVGQIDVYDENSERVKLKLSNVLFVPELESNLVSVGKLNSKGVEVLFKDSSCGLFYKRQSVATARKIGDVYELSVVKERSHFVRSAHNVNCQHIWHKRFGHRDLQVITDIIKGELAENFDPRDCGIHEPCEACMEGKMARQSFPKKSKSKSKEIMDLIHTDVGVSEIVTPSGNKYFMTIIDDYSRYSFVSFLKKKSEVAEKIKEFVAFARVQFGKTPKRIRSDQGGEYSSKDLLNFYKKEGIKVEFTAGYSPQQNGVAERKNRYLAEMARSMLADSKLHKRYWAEAISTANHLQNILPSSAVDRTPHELFYKAKPSYKNLKAFGCVAYVHVHQEKRKKFDKKAEKLTFVGYSNDHKAYRFLDPSTSKITISRDAVFLENGMKYEIPEPVVESQNEVFLESSLKDIQSRGDSESEDDFLDMENMVFHEDRARGDTTEENQEENHQDNEAGNSQSQVRRSSRPTKGIPPERFSDQLYLTLEVKEPTTIDEAMKSSMKAEWQVAMKEEINSLRENNTWELVQLPPDKKPIRCKWIFKAKTDEKGEIVKHKARLVAMGFTQKFGVDYDAVFAPVVRQITFRTILSIASVRKMIVKHVDVKTAYLYGELDEVIYMRQPPGYQSGDKSQVCLLKKSIYGLKQGARKWNQKIDEILRKFGFDKSKEDPCLYVKVINERQIFILIYVDDLIIICYLLQEFLEIKEFLERNFKITVLGDISYFLGIQIEKFHDIYHINQKSYIEKVAARFGLSDAKISKIPIDVSYVQQKEEISELLESNDKFRSLVGCLLYIAVNSRPDISIAVSLLSRKVEKPNQTDWIEAKRVVRYLIGTKDLKLKLGNSENLLQCYVDADWANDQKDRKSNSGYIIKLGSGLIGWGCKKQNCVALSSTEAEYVAMAECCKELRWLVGLLKDIDIKIIQPVQVFEDNQSCIKIIESEKVDQRSKHIDTKYNFIKDMAQEGEIKVQYCDTENMVADILTKPLSSIKIERFRKAMGLQNVSA